MKAPVRLPTPNVMTRIELVCGREKLDWVVVVGDVNSTMARLETSTVVLLA